MKDLVGKIITVYEVSYANAVRDKQPEEVWCKGQVLEVDGHMIKMKAIEASLPCSNHEKYDRWNTRISWFNTMASTFKSIRENIPVEKY